MRPHMNRLAEAAAPSHRTMPRDKLRDACEEGARDRQGHLYPDGAAIRPPPLPRPPRLRKDAARNRSNGMKAAGATLDRQVSADGGGDRPVRNTRSSGTQQQQQPSKPPTKVIVVQAPKAGAVQAALPTKTILIHPPNSTNNAQRIGNNNNNNNNNSSNSSPSMQHVVVHRQSPASPSTITVTLSDSELRQAVSEQSAATALYTTQPGTPLAYVTTQPEFGSVAAATQLVAGTAVHPHHASTQHHMDPYPLSAPTPHHHLQTTYCRTWLLAVPPYTQHIHTIPTVFSHYSHSILRGRGELRPDCRSPCTVEH
uniref:Uncharacterized protein n=1 Tax=Plectus sambesii TaxID=2011161 RepID=A0A914VAR3_9BILA